MFAITGKMSWDPSERDDLIKTLTALGASSREEEGNVDYWWAEDLSEPGAFHVFEHWASEEAFNRHCQTPGYLGFAETWMPRIKNGSAARLEISGSQSLTG